LEGVDEQQQDEGCEKHDHRDGGRPGVVILLQLGDDQQCGDLGFHGHVAGNKDHGSVFTEGAGEGQGKSCDPRRKQGG
jgi:hypothetical protein